MDILTSICLEQSIFSENTPPCGAISATYAAYLFPSPTLRRVTKPAIE